MPLRRFLIPLAVAGIAALAPAAAHAGIFPGEVIDGPSADILSVGGVDVAAADGTGGVVELRADGGVAHVFVARLVDGAWLPPERVDTAFAQAASEPVIAASTGGRLVVAWVTGGTLVAIVKPSADAPWTAPQPVGGPAASPAIDMGYNDNAYLAWTSGGDVLAARLPRGATQFQPVAGPLDLDAAHPAGDAPDRRPSIAVSAEGLALATWGELFPDGRSHVIARRIDGVTPSPVPADLTLDALDGRPGGDADRPVATIQSDSSFGWVAFRQAFADGGVVRTRAVARYMRGSRFEPAIPIDGQSFPGVDVGAPNMATAGGGVGFAAVPNASGALFGRAVNGDAEWSFPVRLDSAPVPQPDRPPVVYSEDKTGLVAWPSADRQLRLRTIGGTEFHLETQVTKPELGPVDFPAGVVAAGDRSLNAAVVAIQGSGADRRLVAAMVDREPGNFSPLSSSRWYRTPPARLRWREPKETWGPLTYTLEIDGRAVGTTRRLSYPTAGLGLTSGTHLWRVTATDRRGQASASPTRFVRIDRDPPHVTISFGGSRRAGHVTRVAVRAIDRDSGSQTPRISFGDGTAPVVARSAAHVFRRGHFTVTVRASDNAGNTTTERRRIVIR